MNDELLEAMAPADWPGEQRMDAPASAHWKITDEGSADWAMQKLAAAQAEEARINKTAAEQAARIEVWRAKQVEVHQRSAAFFKHLLTDWLAQVNADNPKTLSVALPSGSVVSRAGRVTIHVVDSEAFIDWAEVYRPSLVKVTQAPRKDEIKKVLQAKDVGGIELALIDPDSGEIVPGVVAERGERTFDAVPD